MGDRVLMRRECDMCFRKFHLGSLMRIQFTDQTDSYDLDNRVVCTSCRDYLVLHWWRLRPEAHRYYHPA